MKQKNRIGPCPRKDEQRVREWYNAKGYYAYEWVKRMRKARATWHQILGRITGEGL